jgi:hypothetical protein
MVMKTYIPDQSEYRPGDEFDVRSPYYEDQPSSEFVDNVITLKWEVNTHGNVYKQAWLTVNVHGELEYPIHKYQRYSFKERSQEYSLLSVDIISLRIGKRVYLYEEAKKLFDEDTFNMSDIIDHASDYLSREEKYTFKE